MKTKITQSINSAAIAIALFCAVAILSPSPTSINTTINDRAADALRHIIIRQAGSTPGSAAMTRRCNYIATHTKL